MNCPMKPRTLSRKPAAKAAAVQHQYTQVLPPSASPVSTAKLATVTPTRPSAAATPKWLRFYLRISTTAVLTVIFPKREAYS